jgi:hypothetical protein
LFPAGAEVRKNCSPIPHVNGSDDPVLAGFDEAAFEASHEPETTRFPLMVVWAAAPAATIK